jgi:hypothetical protein
LLDVSFTDEFCPLRIAPLEPSGSETLFGVSQETLRLTVDAVHTSWVSALVEFADFNGSVAVGEVSTHAATMMHVPVSAAAASPR